jgi:excisionase family DNA binding protein
VNASSLSRHPKPLGEPLYFTAAQLAALLQVDTTTVYRWASLEPSMPVLRVGGVVRFPREAVLRWLAEQQQGQASPRRCVQRSAIQPRPETAPEAVAAS